MAEQDGKDETEEQEREPWQAIMTDVAGMMKEAIKKADFLMSEYVGPCLSSKKVKLEIVIPMATAIFDATVTAEGGRRMVEAQKEMAQKRPIQGGVILQMGPDGRPLPRV